MGLSLVQATSWLFSTLSWRQKDFWLALLPSLKYASSLLKKPPLQNTLVSHRETHRDLGLSPARRHHQNTVWHFRTSQEDISGALSGSPWLQRAQQLSLRLPVSCRPQPTPYNPVKCSISNANRCPVARTDHGEGGKEPGLPGSVKKSSLTLLS